MKWFFLTVGYSGLLPKAPGTWGSLVSLIMGIALLFVLPAQTLFLSALLITLFAIKIIDKHEVDNEHDDKRIVIDELVGMWIALSIAPASMISMETLLDYKSGIAIELLLSFVLFRYFDIKKPSIIGRIDRETKGGLGVMGDDVIAGLAAGISTAILFQAISLILV